MDEKQKKELIQQVSAKMTCTWEEEIPLEIMQTADGSDIIYSASLLTFFRVAKVLDVDLSQCYKHLEEYFLAESVSAENAERNRNELN